MEPTPAKGLKDKLKSLLDGIGEKIDVDLGSIKTRDIKFAITTTFSKLINVTVNRTEKHLHVNINVNSPDYEKNKHIVQEIVSELKDDEATFIEESALIQAKEIEDSKEDDAVNYFLKILEEKHLKALRASVVIKKEFDHFADREKITYLKRGLIEKCGVEGKNISNLYSQGYFEKFFIPLHKEIKNDEQFRKLFSIIVSGELSPVFFVTPYDDTVGILKIKIKKKLMKNTKYGMRRLYIHGIGHDKKQNIIQAVESLQKEGVLKIINKKTEPGFITYAVEA